MDARELRAGVDSALDRGASPEQRIRFLLEVAQIYEEEGVLDDGEALPLWEHCPCAEPCWSTVPESFQPGRDPADPWNGGMIFPWIGERYGAGGVAVLGINLREASGLHIEYEIASGQLERLEAGHKKPHRMVGVSVDPYGSGRAQVDGRRPSPRHQRSGRLGLGPR